MPNPKGGNPPEEYRFKPGQSGNPGGKTAEQRAAEVKAAELSAKMRLRALESLQSIVEGKDAAADIYEALVTSDNLRLFKDSEDRAHGQPDQTVNNRHSGAGAEKLGAFLDSIAERSGKTGETAEE